MTNIIDFMRHDWIGYCEDDWLMTGSVHRSVLLRACL